MVKTSAAAWYFPTQMTAIGQPHTTSHAEDVWQAPSSEGDPGQLEPPSQPMVATTESWAEYRQVVLSMAILETLLNIEEKLSTRDGATGDAADTR
jgi:hypothetical protein